jgi:hypothetical protein
MEITPYSGVFRFLPAKAGKTPIRLVKEESRLEAERFSLRLEAQNIVVARDDCKTANRF